MRLHAWRLMNAARRWPSRKASYSAGIENVEVATGIPSLMMGYNVEDIARRH